MKKPLNSAISTGVDISRPTSCSKAKVPLALAGGHDVEPDDGGQHEQPADQAVEQELHRGVRAARAAEAADEEVHRDEHRLEEDVEQEDVGRGEDADHHRLEDEQQGEEGLDAALGRVGAAAAGDGGSSTAVPAPAPLPPAERTELARPAAPLGGVRPRRGGSAAHAAGGLPSGRSAAGGSASSQLASTTTGDQHGDQGDQDQRDAVDADGVLHAEGGIQS
jgi:hypothetical protein